MGVPSRRVCLSALHRYAYRRPTNCQLPLLRLTIRQTSARRSCIKCSRASIRCPSCHAGAVGCTCRHLQRNLACGTPVCTGIRPAAKRGAMRGSLHWLLNQFCPVAKLHMSARIPAIVVKFHNCRQPHACIKHLHTTYDGGLRLIQLLHY